MDGTSDVLFNEITRQDAVVFDIGFVVDPFRDNIPLANDRSPLMCIQCAAYMNSYSKIDTIDGSWICSLCSSTNPSFLGNQYGIQSGKDQVDDVRRRYTELNGNQYTFAEEVPLHSALGSDTMGFGHSGKGSQLPPDKVVFAMDRNLCGDTAAVALVCDGLTTLPDTCEVMLVLFDRHLRLLRLSGGVLSCNDPIAADIVSGAVDQSSLLGHQMHRNLYFIQAKTVKASLAVLKDGLMAFYSPPVADAPTLANKVDASLTALLGAVLTAVDPPRFGGGSQTPSNARLVLLTSQSIYCTGDALRSDKQRRGPSGASPLPSCVVNRLAPYAALGRRVWRRGCAIDVFYASMRAANLDCFDALVTASGGSVVSASAFAEPQLRASFLRLLARGSGGGDGLFAAVMPTIEVRTCGRLVVDGIVGPVASAEDVAQNNLRGSTAETGLSGNGSGKSDRDLAEQAAKLSLDDAHLSQSLFYLRDYENPSRKLEDFQAKLWQHNAEHVVLSGVNLRCHGVGDAATAHDAVTVQLKLPEQGSQAGSSLLARRSLAIGNAEAKDSSPGSAVSAGPAYVQVVARFYLRCPGKAGTLQKITRVWTQQVRLTNRKEEHLRSLDAPRWAHIQCRGIVADYHTRCAEVFGGAASNRLDEEGRNDLVALKDAAVASIDALAKTVAEQWPINPYTRSKVAEVCRILYALREGPLLDGPAADHMEAYLLRTRYLRAPYGEARLLVLPALSLWVPVQDVKKIDISRGNADKALSADELTALYPAPGTAVSSSAPSPLPTPAPGAPLHLLFPPPSPAAPSSLPSTTAGFPAASPAGLTARFPPPPAPSPRGLDATLTARFPPPPSPAVRPTTAALTSTGVGIAAHGQDSANKERPATEENSTGSQLVAVPAESIWLLPGTIAVMDCGDRIVIRENSAPAFSDDNSATVDSGAKAKDGGTALKVLAAEVQAWSAQRYPAPTVFTLHKPGTPQDRMLYCRLAPAHMDAPDAVLAALIAGPPSEAAEARNSSNRATISGLQTQCAALTMKDVEAIIARAPFTDQPSFAKYLINLVPGQAGKLLGRVPLTVAEDGGFGSAPSSQKMDRGPISVYQPPSSSNTPKSAYSSSDALPI